MDMKKISIIVPVFNETHCIVKTLNSLLGLRQAGHELIVVDGGSTDDTIETARPMCDVVITAPKGRASQMNAGVTGSSGDILWFVHADTCIQDSVVQIMLELAEHSRVCWGRFNVRLSGQATAFRVIEYFMNLRSRFTGIATGDQAIFMHRRLYEQIGGYPDIAIMEDVAICKALKKISRPLCFSQRVITDSRRWERNGVLRTILLMWRLRLAYALGVNPGKLAKLYY
jgi:rSAM/selenodomain-associated transferase 2